MKSKGARKRFVMEWVVNLASEILDPDVNHIRGGQYEVNGKILCFYRVIQKRPYTAVYVDFLCDILESGVGFSKVNYPDRWDARYGRELALRKALAEIARKL